MRGSFSKGLLLQIGMQQQQIECIPCILNWNIAIFAVLTDFTNMAVMLFDLLRNLTFNRSTHCPQVSDQCPLGLLFLSILWRKFGYVPNGKSYLFFPIFVQKFPIPKIRKYVVKQRFLEGLKLEKVLYWWECKWNRKKESQGSEYN